MADSPNVKRVGVWRFVVTTFGGTYYGRASTIFNTAHQSNPLLFLTFINSRIPAKPNIRLLFVTGEALQGTKA